MCAERPKDAVRSPWTEGAWIMRLQGVPSGWLWRNFTADEFEPLELSYEEWTHSLIVEARPATEADR